MLDIINISFLEYYNYISIILNKSKRKEKLSNLSNKHHLQIITLFKLVIDSKIFRKREGLFYAVFTV